jgi:hypothetical protein
MKIERKKFQLKKIHIVNAPISKSEKCGQFGIAFFTIVRLDLWYKISTKSQSNVVYGI